MGNLEARQFKKINGNKIRNICIPNESLKIEINILSQKLIEKFKLKKLNRIEQSKNDIKYFNHYHYVLFSDGKKALESGNIISICLILLITHPSSIILISRVLKIYFASVYDDHGNFINVKNKLKIGYRSSELIMQLAFKRPLQVFNFFGESQLYVDDLVLYSNSNLWIKVFYLFLKTYLFALGFRLHKTEFYDLKLKPKKAGGRLGILFGFHNNVLTTKVRQKTLSKYLKRIAEVTNNYPREKALYLVSRKIYGHIETPYIYPVFDTFHKGIWTNKVQKKIFFNKVLIVLNRKYPEMSTKSKKEISDLLWNYQGQRLI